MTMGKNRAPRMMAIPAAALAALMLAGCSSGHVGDDWQCPLAAGGSCASVAAADPAVPKAGAVPATGQPLRLLPRDAETERADPSTAEPRLCNAGCGFDPFAWLARLFGVSDDSAPRSDGNAKPATDDSAVAATPDARSADSAAALPAATGSGDDGPQADDLRTGEVVARIWIAPFVDANGIYREATHVRVVLEPAGWRLP